MAGLIRMSLDAPEEVRPFEGDSGQLELVNLDAGPVGRATFKPGWQVVRARQADRRYRQLPGRAHRLLRLRPDEGRDGRRRGDRVRARRLRGHAAGPRRVDRRRRAAASSSTGRASPITRSPGLEQRCCSASSMARGTTRRVGSRWSPSWGPGSRVRRPGAPARRGRASFRRLRGGRGRVHA